MKTALYTGLRFLEDVIRGDSVLKHLLRLRRMRDADPEFIREYQFAALKKLVDFAYKNSPFYTRKFDEQGVKPGDIKTLDDFAKLKPVTREEVQDHTFEFISRGYNSEKLIRSSSSGSTGQPISLFQDKAAYSAGRAGVLMGWELSGMKLGDKIITLWGNRETIETRWSKPMSRLKAAIYRDKRIPVDRFVDESYFKEILDILKKRRGGYIFGYSHAISGIANYIKERGIEFERKFDGIYTTAEKLIPQNRAIIEEVLGPVYDCYGSREILAKAYQCKERKGYHIIEPNVIFEAEDFEGKTKDIVVTDLWNYAWPLIRYKIGDLISGEFGGCDCDCTWKTFPEIIGRTTDILRLPDGTVMHPLYWWIYDLSKYWYTFKKVQFARVAEDKMVFRVQLFENEKYEFWDNMKEDLEKRFAQVGMKFEVKLVDRFPVYPGFKHRSVVDET